VLHVCFSIILVVLNFSHLYLIRIISQSYNEIGDDGTRAIADAIRTNSSVQSLNLVRMCCR
jgi:hypothetical protein